MAGPNNSPDVEQGGSPEEVKESNKEEELFDSDTDEANNFDEGDTSTNARPRLNTEIPRGAIN